MFISHELTAMQRQAPLYLQETIDPAMITSDWTAHDSRGHTVDTGAPIRSRREGLGGKRVLASALVLAPSSIDTYFLLT
jgi:hypothetical protein